MEQNKNIDKSMFVKYKWKNYLKSTVETIKVTKTLLKLFDNIEDQDFLRIINTQVEKLLKEVEKLKELHEDPEKILNIVLDFIEDIFKNFDVKMFYNLTPNISYNEYADKQIWEQIINNLFDWKLSDKSPNFIEKDYVKWWNCHHRSILIKKIFDEIKIPWVACKIRRFPKSHSLLVFTYKDKYWFLDMIEEWRVLNLKEINKQWWFKNYEITNKVLYDEGSSIMDFDSIEKFSKNAENESNKWIRLQIDRIKAEVEWDILKIEITKDKWKKKRYFEIRLNKYTKTYNKKEFITKIVPWIQRALIIVWKKLPKWYLPESEKF